MSRPLAELLVRERIITPAQFSEVQQELGPAAKDGRAQTGFVRRFIDKRYLSETKLLFYLSQKFGLPSINLEKFDVNPEIIKHVPAELAAKHQVIPIQSNQKGTLVVALCDPTLIAHLEGLKFALKLNIEAVLTSFSAFESSFAKYYGSSVNVSEAIESFRREKKKENEEAPQADPTMALEVMQVHDMDQGSLEQDQPVITLVNGILTEAIRKKASDIHVEPYEKRLRVRYRLDGALVEAHEIPSEMRRAVVARFKIMARMDIGESRVPQDGRIKLRVGRNEIDFRVSSLPTLFGEKIVLRLLSRDALHLDLTKLGFDSEQLKTFRKGIQSPSGMVLVTGPTGSGKTTTLYSALLELNQISDNISTAEDPVEYNFEGINQVQVNNDLNLNFPNILRTLLRQDPDIILVGEIRDFETAEVAIQAALTGHMVLSTVHTNDAPSTVVRLQNMGIEPFLITAAINTIVAQRLLRLICQKCRVEVPTPADRLIELGFTPEQAARVKPMRGQGCPSCNRTGYRGRAAIYEVMDFSNTLKEMVVSGRSLIEVRKQAAAEGMRTLRQAALARVAQGATTLEEAIAITMEG